MREWNFSLHENIAFTLAADARLGGTDYANDHIWSLSAETGDPPALAAGTTFGLRARSFRIFPRFGEDDRTIGESGDFTRPAVVRRMYPNYLQIDFSPFEGIDVQAEYWVPDSHSLAGRLRIVNSSQTFRLVRFELSSQLTPIEGERMAPAEMQATTVLRGCSENLYPVIFMTGGPTPGSGPYPSLALDLELSIGQTHTLTWTQAALEDYEASFALARELAARPWAAEIARIEMINAGGIEIYTGNQEWDLVLALAQRQALQLFVGPTGELPGPSFVFTRQLDQGYSMRADGSDYDHLWCGQTPLESYFLAGLALPAAPDLAKALVLNFVASQAENGALDWRPGLGGQRSQMLATPIIASTAWKIYAATQDIDFLGAVYQPLLNFLQAWFSEAHDRDGDGIPEWDHATQSGFEDHPLFSPYHDWTHNVDITAAESPSLCAMLYNESQALMRMGSALGQNESNNALTSFCDHLRTALETSWDERGTYRYWDRDTHLTQSGELLGERQGAGIIDVNRQFDQPVRIQFRLLSDFGTRGAPDIFVHGLSASGKNRVEHLTQDRFRWNLGRAVNTGDKVYSAIEQIDVRGINPDVNISAHVVGLDVLDQSLLLPLWGGPDFTRHAEQIVTQTLVEPDLFWSPYGLRACPYVQEESRVEACQNIHVLWNHLIGEGLLAHGYRQEAAEMVSNLMKAIIQTIQLEGAFRRYYDAENGLGRGERGALSGLAPLELFLETLGVRLLSPWKVALAGKNPFQWPVTVKYRGLTVLRGKEKTSVIFPDGQTASIEDNSAQILTLEPEETAPPEKERGTAL